MFCTLVLLLAAPAAAQIPPDGRWQTYETEHFRVTFPPEVEALARRAGDRAEKAYAALAEELVAPPRGKVDLLLANNTDLANGYARVFPTARVIVYTHAPADTRELTYYQDWLDLVVLHELVHIFHLDASRGVWAKLRAVLGRNPLLFPAVFSPGWLTEGLATYFESRLTGAGRVRGTLHDMTLRTAILEDAFFPIDRVTGSSTRWPGGSTRYVYGSLFIDYLARTRAPESIPAFVEEAAGSLPYRLDRNARRTLGIKLTDAWEQWEQELRTRYLASADSLRASGLTEPEILTDAGRLAAFPRYSAGGALAYSAATAREQPAIRLILPDGGERVLQKRANAGSFGWASGERIVYGDLDYADPYRIYSDLHQVELSGADRRLTREARLADPDVHPDGRRVVAVADANGTNALVIHDMQTGSTRRITEPSLDVQWSLPRWSPAGHLIAVSRWTAGGLRDVVLVDSAGAVIREVTRDRALDTAPTWTPDGRIVVFSSDRTGIANLYAFDLGSGELFQTTNLLTGGFDPAVSPDGRWIAFSYYRSDGYHIARIPFEPARWRAAPPARADFTSPLPPRDYLASAAGEDRPYSPWRSLRPSTWAPIIDSREHLGLKVGVALGGVDLVERHEWAAELAASPRNQRVDGAVTYRYRGLGNPVLALSASQEWDVAATVDAAGKALPTALLERERQAGASLIWLRRRWTSTSSVSLAMELTEPDLLWDEPSAAGQRRFRQTPADVAAVLHAGYNSARGFGISLGPQTGATASLRAESHRYLEPFQGDSLTRGYLRLTGRGRRFHALALPGFTRHVLALRADAAAETGSVSPGLRVGGATGGALGAALGLPLEVSLLGHGVAFPIRGYPEAAQRGNRAVTASAEYRFPIARPERGVGLLPFFFNRVWGDVFLDGGAAWCAGACARRLPNTVDRFTPLASVGAELDLDLQLGFVADLPLRFGAALPLRQPGENRVRGYVRVGRSF
ncbi:MAG: hypothetical protein KY464_13965 [Gemmatimonadetes bacterium]|nr:hypothetical protein [Gemmatimonadota bacterium]